MKKFSYRQIVTLLSICILAVAAVTSGGKEKYGELYAETDSPGGAVHAEIRETVGREWLTLRINGKYKHDIYLKNLDAYQLNFIEFLDDRRLGVCSHINPSTEQYVLVDYADGNVLETLYGLDFNWDAAAEQVVYTKTKPHWAQFPAQRYDYETLISLKSPYVGDHINDMAVVANLLIPDERFIQRFIKLETDDPPFGLYAFYEPENEEIAAGSMLDADAGQIMKSNALMLFCLIENLDVVRFMYRYTPSPGKLEEDAYEGTAYYRGDFEKTPGDLSGAADSVESLRDIMFSIE